MALTVTSPAFESNGDIPPKYTCDGEDMNPAVRIGNIPAGTKSVALVMDDPDAPMGTWDHWIFWDMDPAENIDENIEPKAVQGRNSWGRNSYGGPCPPSGSHRYFFKVYALDTMLHLDRDSGKRQLQKAMTGHILDQGELVGRYSRR